MKYRFPACSLVGGKMERWNTHTHTGVRSEQTEKGFSKPAHKGLACFAFPLVHRFCFVRPAFGEDDKDASLRKAKMTKQLDIEFLYLVEVISDYETMLCA